ncbi:MAG: hypothetical protein QGG50_06495, partial [Methanopyri archaeon]|nr:hypothetical protein [Methanopyri archaeon]
MVGTNLPDPPSRFHAAARPVGPPTRTDRSAIEDAVERTSGLRFLGWLGPDARPALIEAEDGADDEDVFNAGARDALQREMCAVLAHDERLPPPTLPTGIVLSGTTIIGEEDLGTIELAPLQPGYGIYPGIDGRIQDVPWVVLVPTTLPTLVGATVGSPSF